MEEAGNTEDARRYTESLLVVLAEGRTRVVQLLAETPAEWAVSEAGAYQRGMNRAREARLQFCFHCQGGPTCGGRSTRRNRWSA
ncbi:hypothetical protein [Actinacidiphila acidipaludis]|uniref:Uncharacterized protein n=1 Tax=Actinacidiphila acidipaludis TaxID=2873382 RepID=A0ABS7QJF2_9ACTN|nr:hypothetical protein [Streptomyces acidipaludis]MBY8882814.1 hypothetical protein [Streptomyces acidipaludis]